MAKAKKTILSQVSKRGRDAIATIMQERGGHLSVEEFLAKRWNLEETWRFQFPSIGGTKHRAELFAKRIAEAKTKLAELHPDWSPEQIQIKLSLDEMSRDLRESSIARRFTLDDPAELGRGLGVVNRIHQIRFPSETPISRFKEYLEVCAVRDIAIIEKQVQGVRAGYTAIADDWNLADVAVTAILQKDFETLKLVTPEMPNRKWKHGEWLECLYRCFIGIAEHSPDKIKDGLQDYLGTIIRLRDKDELLCAINLEAHGMYRLCEWISPELVAGFDATQPFPWDAEFHAWSECHPNPVEGLDLNHISPVLHEALILQTPPEWLVTKLPELHEIILKGSDPKNSKALDLIESCAGVTQVRGGKKLLERCPMVLRWNLDFENAQLIANNIANAGADVEVRAMDRTPFRFQ